MALRAKLLILILLASSALHAAVPRRVLHVSLYPYIPQPEAAALSLKQGFERLHPDVIVQITLNPNYYSQVPADRGVLFEDADVHEIDVVFLSDFLKRHKLAPLPAHFADTLDRLEPLARQAATRDGALVAVPQWMCTDFLIFRAGAPGTTGLTSLDGLEHAFAQRGAVLPGLLIDLKGDDTLGELYLSTVLAEAGSPEGAEARLGTAPDPVIVARFRRLLAMEPAGFGRSADYDARGTFYARQFARRAGSAYLGYSETVNAVLAETAISCRLDDHCVTADQIGVAAFPFHDGLPKPLVWVDMFGIDSRVHGQALADAAEFIRYAVSQAAYRALLVPQPGELPRYLLPASVAAFTDAQIFHAAPLYTQFRAIMEQGAVISAPDLPAVLHRVAALIDADLPSHH